MRQAGRSLPEYRALRKKHGILELCRTPDLAVEVTLQPVRRLGVDAAILFNDIVVPLQAMGIGLDIQEGVGPVIAEPVRSVDDVARVEKLVPELDVPDAMEAVRTLVGELDVPLIGFGGAPFTLACYLVQGRPSRDHSLIRSLILSQPGWFDDLLGRLATMMTRYLHAQLDAGAHAIQLFDSWVGVLPAEAYRDKVLPHVARIFDALAEHDVPLIYFGLNTGELLSAMGESGATVIGVDWRIPLDEARKRIGRDLPLQGNLDPAACLAGAEVATAAATDVLERGSGGAHVFNLGHGVLPDTDPDVLSAIVDTVHSWSVDV